MTFQATRSFATKLDREDPLVGFRAKFFIPRNSTGSEVLYFCGNSLGLQPRNSRALLEEEMLAWETLGVEGHFKENSPWVSYHELVREPISKLVGALPSEVVSMNSLTVNLHLLFVSFYRPNAKRHKILIEGSAFPSDQYAVKSQLMYHGYDPRDALIEIFPRDGERILRMDDIVTKIEETGDSIAIVFIGGVNYSTGQVVDMKRITEAGHKAGCRVGFDLAHAIGNIPMNLHDWKVDFAVWCTYKYLNAGPGAIGGCFIHEQ
ncbi:MAG TPA: kynureninase, partial [Candidatus Hodarchaeales archaeon]|nr:kynureninase [Candidatus Hodarchaeales archaeon]